MVDGSTVIHEESECPILILTLEQMRLLTRKQLFSYADEIIAPHDIVCMNELSHGFIDFDLRYRSPTNNTFYAFASGCLNRPSGPHEPYLISFTTEWQDEHGADLVPSPILKSWRRLATLLDCELTCEATAYRGEEGDAHDLELSGIKPELWPNHLSIVLAIMALVFHDNFPLLNDIAMKSPTWKLVNCPK
mgnify:CR=1 FL=1